MKSRLIHNIRTRSSHEWLLPYRLRVLSTLEPCRRSAFAVQSLGDYVSERRPKKVPAPRRPCFSDEYLDEFLARQDLKQNSEVLDMHMNTAKALLDHNKYCPGSFASREYVLAKESLDFLLQSCSPDIILTCLRILERLVDEQVHKPVPSHLLWFCLPRFWNKILKSWLTALHQNPEFLSSADLSARLKRLNNTLPEFRYNNETVRMLVQGALLQLPNVEAPFAIERILQEWKTDSSPYVLLFDAWLKSGLEIAPQKIEEFAEYVLANGLTPCPILFNALVKHWAELGATLQVEKVINTMEKYHVKLYPSTLSFAVLAYTKLSDVNRAEIWFERMIQERHSQDRTSKQDVFKAILNILNSYRSIVFSRQSTLQAKSDALSSAQNFIESVKSNSTILQANFYKTEVFGLMITMIAEMGLHEQVENMLDEHPHDAEILSKVIGIYKNNKLADRADGLLKTAISKRGFIPKGIHLFNLTLSAWAECPDQHSIAHAFELFRCIKEDPTCKIQAMQPDLNTYNYLLTCLVTNAELTNNVGEKVLYVWDDMQSAGTEPSQETYYLSIKALLLAGDYDQASMFLSRMESTKWSSPSIQPYIALLQFLAKHASPLSAEKAENILNNLRMLVNDQRLASETNNIICEDGQGLQPLSPLPTICYSLVMSCLSKSGTHDSLYRLLNTYEQMKADGVPHDIFTYGELINALTDSSDLLMMEKASSLLHEMTSNTNVRPWGSLYARVSHGWFQLGQLDRALETLQLVKKSVMRRPGMEKRFALFVKEMLQVAFHCETSSSAFARNFLDEILAIMDGLCLGQETRVDALKTIQDAWLSSGRDGNDLHFKNLEHRIVKTQNDPSQ